MNGRTRLVLCAERQQRRRCGSLCPPTGGRVRGTSGEVDSNTIPIYLAQYYFLTGRTQEALDMVEQYWTTSPQTRRRGRPLDLLEQYEQDTDDYRTGVQYIAWKLDTWNQENMGEITVDEEARAFIARMGS
ncbi:MAG: hypothetical protein ACLSB9_21900 [Hydrogeniiclostridium mannosilyticum]